VERPRESPSPAALQEFLDDRQLEELDLFDRAQRAFVVDVCRHSRSLSDAGRTLLGASRTRKTFSNGADRLRKIPRSLWFGILTDPESDSTPE
jgi:sigma54-dependent transcription regulator